MRMTKSRTRIVATLSLMGILIAIWRDSREQDTQRAQVRPRTNASKPAQAETVLAQTEPGRRSEATLFKPDPGQLAKRPAGWKPTSGIVIADGAAEVLQLEPAEVLALARCFDELTADAAAIFAEEAMVVANGNEQVVYLPAGNSNWPKVKQKFEAGLAQAIGQDKADYLLQASAPDFNLITGEYGKYARIAAFQLREHPGHPDLPPVYYQFELLRGNSALGRYEAFEPEIRARIDRELEPGVGGVAHDSFSTPPALFKGIVDFESDAPAL